MWGRAMKRYIKPTMEIEKIEMNQAIAACNTGRGNFVTEFLGYHETWERSYASVPDGMGTVYDTIEAAQNAAAASSHAGAPIGGVYGCWYVDGTSRTWVCYYEDLDLDRRLDLEDGDNWQTVMAHSEIYQGYYMS